MVWENLDERLMMLDLDVKNSDEVFEQMGGRLVEEGYCKDTYVAALKERESHYPTGVDLDGVNFAMPHTDRVHVNKTAVAVGVLKEPVHFFHMGTEDQDVMVNVIFMLAVKDPNAHIDVLGRLLQMFQDQSMLESITKAKDQKEIITIFKNKETELEAEA